MSEQPDMLLASLSKGLTRFDCAEKRVDRNHIADPKRIQRAQACLPTDQDCKATNLSLFKLGIACANASSIWC